MKGVTYLVDEQGHRKAVQIDLEEWGELWEDFYDSLIIEERKDEPEVPWEEVKRRDDALRNSDPKVG